MLKASSKRRRTKAEVKADTKAELDRENEIRTKFARLEQVEMQQAHTEHQANVNKVAAVLMCDLVNAGVVKQTDQSSFVVQGREGELNFDYAAQ